MKKINFIFKTVLLNLLLIFLIFSAKSQTLSPFVSKSTTPIIDNKLRTKLLNLNYEVETDSQKSKLSKPLFYGKIDNKKNNTSQINQNLRTEEIKNWSQAAIYSKDSITELKEYLFTLKNTHIFKLNINLKNNTLQKISYIIFATNSEDSIHKYLDANNFDVDQKALIEVYLSEIKKNLESISNNPGNVSIYATGDVVGSISGNSTGNNPQKSSGTGSIGIDFQKNNDEIRAKIFLASTFDSIKNGFGPTLLNPGKGKALGSAIIEWYHLTQISFLGNPKLHVYASVANATWGIDTSNTATLKYDYKGVSIWGGGVLLNWPVINGKISSTDIGLNLEIGAGARNLGGDIRSFINSKHEPSFVKAFGSNQNFFAGPEFGMSINVGKITASVQGYCLSKKTEPIYGLTGLQFSFGISINASIFSGLLN